MVPLCVFSKLIMCSQAVPKAAAVPQVVTGSKLRTLTDAALAHLRGAGKQHTMQEEYHHYPRKAEMPSVKHEACKRRGALKHKPLCNGHRLLRRT